MGGLLVRAFAMVAPWAVRSLGQAVFGSTTRTALALGTGAHMLTGGRSTEAALETGWDAMKGVAGRIFKKMVGADIPEQYISGGLAVIGALAAGKISSMIFGETAGNLLGLAAIAGVALYIADKAGLVNAKGMFNAAAQAMSPAPAQNAPVPPAANQPFKIPAPAPLP